MSQPQAFDSLASSYDDSFTYSSVGRYLRQQGQTRLALQFKAGDSVLELGCGTGEDALWLAEHGIRVLATDASEGMLAVARAKCADKPLIQIASLDLRKLSTIHYPLSTSNFDGVFSNFGAMNCLSEWRTLAAWLAEQVKPGGIVGLGVMSPLCVWEALWHGLHGDFRTATRRWKKQLKFQPADSGQPITVTYPTIRRIARDFAPYFRRVYVRPLGLFLPPSDVFGVIEKHPRVLNMLVRLENRFGAISQLSLLADHYWVEFEKT
jgi:SAM-dependent methyltransferase